MDRLLLVKEKINSLIPMIEEEFAKVEVLLDEGSNRDKFLETYFQLKKSVMSMNESLEHPDINATALDAIMKVYFFNKQNIKKIIGQRKVALPTGNQSISRRSSR